MSRRIAVQKELIDIKSELINLGYDVSSIEDNQDVEAIIYMSDGDNIPYNSGMVSMTGEDSMLDNQGAILINATNKSTNEIKSIIDNRVYSPLFE